VIKVVNKIINTALEAGKAILDIYNSKNYEVESKADDSPLTTADLASNSIINDNLKPLGLPILSEENKQIPYEDRRHWTEFWLVDPLDGTKEFIKRNGEFTVNIALIRNNLPVMGVIYAPVPDTLYWGTQEDGSWKLEKASRVFDPNNIYHKAQKLPCEASDPDHLRIVASKSHYSKETEEFIHSLDTDGKEIQLVSRGSSLKLCMLAEGSADLYPRLGPTMEWDTAAGHAIAKFAECEVRQWDSEAEMVYNKRELLNPWFIVGKV
jgi:3'(2'), 5'-bisphosphate nucleotidase